MLVSQFFFNKQHNPNVDFVHFIGTNSKELFFVVVAVSGRARHGLLLSTKKACVFLFYENLQRQNCMSYKHNRRKKRTQINMRIFGRRLSGLAF